MLLFHSATCQKIIPWGKHTQCDAHRGLTSTFLFWEGKRVNPCFSVSERLFLGWQEKGKLLKSLIQNQETFITEIAGWGTRPQILPHIQNTPVMPQMLYIYVLPICWESCLKWLSRDTLVSPPCFTSLLLPAHPLSGSFFIHGFRVLLTNPFHLLRHDNPHSQFKFTAVVFQGFAQRLAGSTDRY